MAISERQPDGTFNDYNIVFAGRRLTVDEAKTIKLELVREPDGLRKRLLLLGYWGERNAKSKSCLEHLLWMIDRHPNQEIHETLTRYVHVSNVATIKSRWLRQLRLNHDDSVVAFNAAHFFRETNPTYALKLLNRAAELDSDSEAIAREIAQLYRSMSMSSLNSLRKNRSLCKSAVKHLIHAVELYAASNHDSSYLLQYFPMVMCDFSEVALELGLVEEAEMLGDILLNRKSFDVRRLPDEKATQHQFGYRREMNNANAILGRAALRRGQVDLAAEHMRRMLQVPVDWFSDWKLAEELLDNGETEIVVQYIEYCRLGWAQITKDFEDGEPNRTGYLPGNRESALEW